MHGCDRNLAQWRSCRDSSCSTRVQARGWLLRPSRLHGHCWHRKAEGLGLRTTTLVRVRVLSSVALLGYVYPSIAAAHAAHAACLLGTPTVRTRGRRHGGVCYEPPLPRPGLRCGAQRSSPSSSRALPAVLSRSAGRRVAGAASGWAGAARCPLPPPATGGGAPASPAVSPIAHAAHRPRLPRRPATSSTRHWRCGPRHRPSVDSIRCAPPAHPIQPSRFIPFPPLPTMGMTLHEAVASLVSPPFPPPPPRAGRPPSPPPLSLCDLWHASWQRSAEQTPPPPLERDGGDGNTDTDGGGGGSGGVSGGGGGGIGGAGSAAAKAPYRVRWCSNRPARDRCGSATAAVRGSRSSGGPGAPSSADVGDATAALWGVGTAGGRGWGFSAEARTEGSPRGVVPGASPRSFVWGEGGGRSASLLSSPVVRPAVKAPPRSPPPVQPKGPPRPPSSSLLPRGWTTTAEATADSSTATTAAATVATAATATTAAATVVTAAAAVAAGTSDDGVVGGGSRDGRKRRSRASLRAAGASVAPPAKRERLPMVWGGGAVPAGTEVVVAVTPGSGGGCGGGDGWVGSAAGSGDRGGRGGGGTTAPRRSKCGGRRLWGAQGRAAAEAEVQTNRSVYVTWGGGGGGGP